MSAQSPDAARQLPSSASVVIIGAGIVGNSLAHHLSRLGATDLVLLDKGPLPNPGGSTGHASNFIFAVDHSKEMTALTVESMRQYHALGVFTECGGIEVARTPQRMQELTRRIASAKSWGIEPVALLTPAEVRALVPYIDESVILGGFHTPGAGVVDSLQAGTLMREGAVAAGLTVSANTEVLGIDVEHGRVRRVRTTRGEVEAPRVVIATGVWSPRLARMAGATIPLTPAVHQMIDIGPVPRFATSVGVEFPIVRDMDTNMYERQEGGSLEIGSYAHRPILHDPDEILSIEESALSPTELPFTQADFELQMEQALELGYARSIGVSNFSVRELDELLAIAGIRPVVNQVQFSPFEYRRGLLEACEERQVAVEAYSPLGTGRHLRDPEVARIAESTGRTPAQVLLRWCLQRDLIVISKSVHRERIEENAQIFDFSLSQEELRALDALDQTGGTDEAREQKWW